MQGAEAAGLGIGVIAVIGGLAIGALAIALRFRQERRKLEHVERIKAFEMGRNLPQDERRLSATKIGAIIATVVPVSVFVPAWLATQLAGYHETIWIAAAMVGLASVIGGSTLAGTALKYEVSPAEPAIDKPYVEEDAYDVVASRG